MSHNRKPDGRQNKVVPMPRDDSRERDVAVIDIELEGQLLGAVLADNAVFRDCAQLTEEHFTDQVHAELWEAIMALRLKGQHATPATISLYLGQERLDGMGGKDFLADLVVRGTALSSAIGEAAERLRQLMQWRRLSILSNEIQDWARRGTMDSDAAISSAIRELELIITASKTQERTKRDVVAAAIKGVMDAKPVPTGINSLDYLMHGGLMAGRLYGLLGKFGRGKTILGGTISDNLNDAREKHLVISIETPPEDIEIRSLARRLDMNAAQLYDRHDPKFKLFQANADSCAQTIPDFTIHEYKPGATMDEIHRAIVRNIHRHGIKGVIIDYWQLIRGREKYQNEEGHLRDCANRLNAIARKEGIWIVLLAQADDFGRPKQCEDGILNAASLCVFLSRGENDEIAHFETVKSNYSRYAATAAGATPGVIFDMAGPHFRSVTATDIPRLEAEAGGDDAITL